MENGFPNEEIKSCPLCASPVSFHKALDDKIIYIPLAKEYLEYCLNYEAVDYIIRDRLRRAEKIIVDLRNRLKPYEKGE